MYLVRYCQNSFIEDIPVYNFITMLESTSLSTALPIKCNKTFGSLLLWKVKNALLVKFLTFHVFKDHLYLFLCELVHSLCLFFKTIILLVYLLISKNSVLFLGRLVLGICRDTFPQLFAFNAFSFLYAFVEFVNLYFYGFWILSHE